MKTAIEIKEFDSNKKIWKVSSIQPVEYTVVERTNFFINSPYEAEIFGPKTADGRTRRLLVIDAKVNEFFGGIIRNYFSHHDIDIEMLILSTDEETKEMTSVFAVLDKITELKLQRRSEPVIAIGGGVLLDIVGFAASLYRRGIPYVRIPTTLIGLIDAGIGIKTGVNYNAHKNRIGTYYSPSAVLLDSTFLSTLDVRHIQNGMGEILKMALIKDSALFELIESCAHTIVADKLQSHSHAQAIMRRSIHSMLEELEKNLWEKDLERLVDFGHSFGPTIEMKALPALLHGESVAIDMAICAVISHQRGLLSGSELQRIFTVYRALDLPIYHEVCEPKLLIDALEDTVSHRDGLQRMPLPKYIGFGIFVNDISSNEIEQAITFLKEKSREIA